VARRALDDALDRRGVHRRQAAEQVLRDLAALADLRQRRELRGREVEFADLLLEMRDMALVRAAQQMADLGFEDVFRFARRGVLRFEFAGWLHRPSG
jgi:hypothetical protein